MRWSMKESVQRRVDILVDVCSYTCIARPRPNHNNHNNAIFLSLISNYLVEVPECALVWHFVITPPPRCWECGRERPFLTGMCLYVYSSARTKYNWAGFGRNAAKSGPRLIFFILGGVTYSETRAAYEMSIGERSKTFDIVIG